MSRPVRVGDLWHGAAIERVREYKRLPGFAAVERPQEGGAVQLDCAEVFVRRAHRLAFVVDQSSNGFIGL